MIRTRHRKTRAEEHEVLWHYEDPQYGGPFCKHPQYGDFYTSSWWPTTQNKNAVTCKNCLKRLSEEEKK